MTSMRIPQTRGEIEAAVEDILYAAHIEPFSRPERDYEKRLAADRELLGAWLKSLSRLGALSRPEMLTRAMVAIEDGSDELQVFGCFRVINVLGRKQWVGGGHKRRAS